MYNWLYNKLKEFKRIIIIYILYALLSGLFIGLIIKPDFTSNTDFISVFTNSLKMIIWNVPMLLLLLIKYGRLYYYIYKKPSELYKVNELNRFRKDNNYDYLTVNKLYKHCKRRCSLLQFTISIIVSIIALVPPIISNVLYRSKIINDETINALNMVTDNIFEVVLGMASSIILILFIYYIINYICIILIERKCND